MNYNFAYKTDQAVLELAKFNIEFCKTKKSYLFNNEWVNTDIEYYYNKHIEKIKKLLHVQLKTGLNHKEYLQNLLDNLNKRIDWLLEKNYNLPEFFENYSIKTVDTGYLQPVVTSNKSSFGNFLNNSAEPDSSEIRVFWFLQLFEKEFNYYKDILDFEKGLLLYTIKSYKHSLSNLYQYIKSIHENVEFTDFKRLDQINFKELEQKQKTERICNFNLDKKSVAHLFRILLEESFLVFDETNETNNRLEMKRFVEDNFTYQNVKKERIPIETFNREYSEVSSPSSSEVKKHKEFIDKLILKLQIRKNTLKD